MTYSIDTQEHRWSQRVPHCVPLFVRCRDSLCTFAGNLRTLEVSHHGCMIHAPRPFPRGTELRLDILHGRRTVTARVVHSHPIGTSMLHRTWTLALELDQPGDIWMVSPRPPDWSEVSEQQRNREHPPFGSNRDTHQKSRS